MPRRKRFKEHVNDHQVATARTFARLGQVLCADDETELAPRVAELGQFVPRRRIADVDGLAERIGDFLRSIS
jgi:UDP-N-acetylglucosamine transferase subunit ALG13